MPNDAGRPPRARGQAYWRHALDARLRGRDRSTPVVSFPPTREPNAPLARGQAYWRHTLDARLRGRS